MRCCTIVLVEVDSQVYSYYYILMKYLQAIKPFEILSAIADMNILKKKDQSSSIIKSKTQPISNSDLQPISLTYQQSQEFILQLRRSVSSQQSQKNAIRRKISIFQNIEIEPHYLQETQTRKMIQFQFHLGSQLFLQRTEALYQQISQINKAVKTILNNKGEAVKDYFLELEVSCQKLNQLINRVAKTRNILAQIKQKKEFYINKLLKKKKLIKEKLYLLKNVKTKNEAAFLQITNIDQAFATEQSRVKLYKKLTKLTELEKSKYVMIIKNRLITISRDNKKLVEQGLQNWTWGKLTEKQIQKVAFMIYFIEKEDIYHHNQIKIDYTKVDKGKLKEEVKKIFEWRSFNYIKDMSTKDRIYEFLNYLLKKIE